MTGGKTSVNPGQFYYYKNYSLKPGSHQLQFVVTVAEGLVAVNNWKIFYFDSNGLQQLLVAADSQLV